MISRMKSELNRQVQAGRCKQAGGNKQVQVVRSPVWKSELKGRG